MIRLEYGDKIESMYHQVYIKGGYVYDPMYSSIPVNISDFINAYQKMNPGGIKIFRP